MADSGKNTAGEFRTAQLTLDNGFTAVVALSDSASNRIIAADWNDCLAKLKAAGVISTPGGWLATKPDKIIKSDGSNITLVKTLKVAGIDISVAVKSQQRAGGVGEVVRSFLSAKAVRNFKMAVKLKKNNIAVVYPLAALQQKKPFLTTGSIYITEYIEGSSNLLSYLRESASGTLLTDFANKKQLCRQIAVIFASLHKASLWHRDAKASNLLINPPAAGSSGRLAEDAIALVDMDGIRRYGIRRRRCRFDAFAKLAATVLWHRSINMTDYLRTFTIYCNLTGITDTDRRRIFRRLSREAVAMRLLALARSAMSEAATDKHKTKAENKESLMPKKILIIKPSALGDIAMALPVLASLRASFPASEITWLVRSEFALLLDGASDLDGTLIFDRKRLGKWWCNPVVGMELVRFITALRRAKFDLVIDLQGLFRTGLFAWSTGCKRRFGMKRGREFASIFYTDKVEQDTDSVHVTDYYQRIVAAAGASKLVHQFNLAPTEQAQEEVAELLKKHNVNPDKYAVLVPGSAHVSKCWPTHKFAKLAGKIASRFGLEIILSGTAAEKPITRRLRFQSNVPMTNFAGLTDIPRLVALLKGARLVVSNDTGPGHIAAALGVPLVLVVGHTNPARIAPHGRPETIVAVEPKERGDAIKSLDPRYAVQNISVDMVFDKIVGQLEQTME